MPSFRITDISTLSALDYYRRLFETKRKSCEFARPMDCGGRAHSDVSASLQRLCVLGFAERRQRTDLPANPFGLPRSRASWEFKITAAGIAKLAEHEHIATKGGVG